MNFQLYITGKSELIKFGNVILLKRIHREYVWYITSLLYIFKAIFGWGLQE